jgi:cytochrome c-type biogenesis protein CcmH/NrfG
MAKVSLRVYNREIEGMIEGGRLDEAVAHCQHILKTFPMHVETYRLLGKSYLEARRYTDAADIFQRVLMAVPDDFVAQVGMSIIRDDEGKLDDAIWHMERAFEDQPSNPAIQGELRRLYGRRDGIEPPKIRLSRDALANMYSQGELFNQAIAEIRAVLAEDTNRPDLQVMLARAYFRAGQKVEAAEMAATLLKKYTYCLEALRILVDVLPGTANADNTQVYRQRLVMLDPYSSFVTDSVFGTEQVPDASVTLERLEFKVGTTPVSGQPNWASSLGIKLADEKRVEPAPDWLVKNNPTQELPPKPVESIISKEETAPEDNSVPDWMRTAGWKESDGKVQEEPVSTTSDQPEEPLAKADIPDWLKSMAPQEVTDADIAGSKSDPVGTAPLSEGDASDWLGKLGSSSTSAPLDSSSSSKPPQEEGSFPDWLKEIGAGASEGTAAAFAAEAMEQSKAEDSLDLGPSISPSPSSQGFVDSSASSFLPVDEPSLEPMGSAIPPEEKKDVTVQSFGESKPLKDDTLAWLENISANTAVKDDGLLNNPENKPEEMPDWMRPEDKTQSGPMPPQHSPEPLQTMPLIPPPELKTDIPVQGLTPPENFPAVASPAAGTRQLFSNEDDSMSWLEGLKAKPEPKPGEIQADSKQQVDPHVDQGIPSSPNPVTRKDEFTPEPSPEDVTITSWLKKQDVEEALGRKKPTPGSPQPASEPSNELPDWLKDLDKPITPREKPKATDNLPDWLNQPVQPAPQESTSVPTIEPVTEPKTPTWMDDANPVSDLPAPTAPGEWVPVDEKPVPVPDLEQDPKPIPTPSAPSSQVRVLGGTGMLARIPTQDKDGEILAAAQTALDASQLNESMREYSKLIKKNKLLEEVIHDLREAIYRFPVDIIVWQTLGDASMRANRLQDALDAYTKAEELLR